MDVLEFQGQYRFLSNFWPVVVKFDGQNYPTVEHAYQAAKTLNKKERIKIQFCGLPGAAKKLGQKVTMRVGWEQDKISVMDDLVWQKFTDDDLRTRLLAIDGIIEEGNYWNDTFWGVCNGGGHNHLGKILMKVRDEIKHAIR